MKCTTASCSLLVVTIHSSPPPGLSLPAPRSARNVASVNRLTWFGRAWDSSPASEA